jgi:hypothetical protein
VGELKWVAAAGVGFAGQPVGAQVGRSGPGLAYGSMDVIAADGSDSESGTKRGRLRRERHGVRRLVEAGVPAAEVAGELVVEFGWLPGDQGAVCDPP